MKSHFFVIFFMLSCLSFAQVGWFNQNSGVNNPLFDVHFVDENNGWIAGNTGLIMHTSDGGVNWDVQTAPPNNTYYSIFFTDNQNGWAGGYAGKLIRTTDGGANWIDGTAGTNRYRYDLYFLNADSGWVVGGDNGVFPTFTPHREIYFTSNGGGTWTSQYAASDESPLMAVHFADSFNGFAVGESGAVMRTTDGGNNWNLDTTITTYHLRDVFFVNQDKGWIIGHYLGIPHVPAIFSTDDGGNNWNTQTFGVDESLSSIYFADEMNGWAVGGTASGCIILHTNDGGVNWTYQNSPTNNALFKVNFVNNNNGWAVGLNGTILKYGDSTFTSISNEDIDQISNRFILSQNYPNPFNPSTTIAFSLPNAAEVTIDVFSMLGEKIVTLLSKPMSAGLHEVEFNANGLPSGTYLYKIQARNYQEVKKIILLR
jgi:photosystem II stability/assembly factor-like uncharacterized protein